jgi:hypothetical protein
MHKLIVRKIFSNESFLNDEMSELEYESQYFCYRLELSLELDFVPQLGMEFRHRGTSFLVDSLTYLTEEKVFYVLTTVDLATPSLAASIIQKHTENDWSPLGG